jgi:hypothetical protein
VLTPWAANPDHVQAIKADTVLADNGTLTEATSLLLSDGTEWLVAEPFGAVLAKLSSGQLVGNGGRLRHD